MRIKFWFLSLLVIFGLTAEAQDTSRVASRRTAGLPFVTAPMTSARQYALIVETGTAQGGVGLYVNVDTLLLAWKTVFPDLGLETRASLANHIRSLKVVPCPRVATNLAWVSGQSIRVNGWRRELGDRTLHPNEMCLLNEAKGRYEVSLACGNLIPNLPSGQMAINLEPRDSIPAEPQALPAVTPGPRRVGVSRPPLDTVFVPREVPVFMETPRRSRNTYTTSFWRSNLWKWTIAAAVVGAGACYHFSQEWNQKPFVCFVDTDVTNIRINFIR